MSTGSKNGAWLADAKLIGGIDTLLNQHPLNCDTTGTLLVSLTATPTIDIGIVDQGLPNTLAEAWPVEITDGTHVLGTVSNPLNVTGSFSPPTLQNVNLTQLNSVALGSPSLYGTSPGAIEVIGVNANITNTVPVTLTSTTITGNVTVVQPTGSNLHVDIDNFPSTQPISGTVTANQGTAAPSTAGWPIIDGNVIAVSAAWTSATSVNTTLAIATAGYASILINNNPTGTITGGAVTFEGSPDSGTTWYTLVNIANITGSDTFAGVYSLAGESAAYFKVEVGGFTNIRIRLSTVITGSGTSNWILQATAIPAVSVVIAEQGNANALQNRLGDGTNLSLLSSTGGLSVSGAVTTAAPTYSTGTLQDLSLNTSGGLRVDGSGVVQPVSSPTDLSPATQNITIVDTGTTTTSGANAQAIYTGTPTAGSVATFSTPNVSSYDVEVTGTWTGTLQVESSSDGGTTWYKNGGHQKGVAFNSSSFTANFQVSSNIAAATNFRVRAIATMTGTAIVKLVASVNTDSVYIINSIQVLSGDTSSNKLTVKSPSTAAVATDPAVVVAISPNNTITANTLPATSGGLLTNVQQALTTSAQVKSSAGQKYGYGIFNPNTGTVYVFWYNTTSAPTIGSTTNLIYQMGIPAGGGAVFNHPIGIPFSTGIYVAVSTSPTSATAPATGLTVTTLYF